MGFGRLSNSSKVIIQKFLKPQPFALIVSRKHLLEKKDDEEAENFHQITFLVKNVIKAIFFKKRKKLKMLQIFIE